MNTFLFPDVNVWLAGLHKRHNHHDAATFWLDSVSLSSSLVICRITQISLLRLLTTTAVMGRDVFTQVEAWGVLDDVMAARKIVFLSEPDGLWRHYREKTTFDEASPKVWADAYLAAFAETAGLSLVTFDRALAGSMTGAILLR